MNKFLFVNPDGDYEESIVEGVYEERNCDSSLAVNDLVFESDSIADTVEGAVSNLDSRTVIGVCVEKKSATVAIILTKGKITGVSGLTKGYKAYLSGSGSLTETKMDYGYIHILGHAVDADVLNFDPSNTKIRKVVMSAPPQTQQTAETNPIVWDVSSVQSAGDTTTTVQEFG